MDDAGPAATHASRRHLAAKGTAVAVVMRHGVNALVGTVVLLDPTPGATPSGKLLMATLAGWAGYRLATRSGAAWATLVDYALTVAVCLAISALVDDPRFYNSNCAPVVVAGTAVVSFALSLPPAITGVMTLGIAAAYAWGSARVTGWGHVPEIFNLYYFALQWTISTAVRIMVLRVAATVDHTRAERQAGQLRDQVTAAVRTYDREQLRLLHDTVASTLLIVGSRTPLPPGHLAAQSQRDLSMLDQHQSPAPPRGNIVEALRDAAAHTRTPVEFTGLPSAFEDGAIAATITSAAREALNNVDRHAAATRVTINVGDHRVDITDDGAGFDSAIIRHGTGLSESIVARMRQIGGDAQVDSAKGHGTRVTLTWTSSQTKESEAMPDPDQLIDRIRMGYGLALIIYALANLVATVPASLHASEHPAAQLTLGLLAAAISLTATPVILKRGSHRPTTRAIVSLVAVTLLQSTLLPTSGLGTQAHWSVGATGWCSLPWLLHSRLPYAATLLTATWVIPATYTLAIDPTIDTAVDIGLGTASIFTVQLSALLFNELLNGAARAAHREHLAHSQQMARRRVTEALQIEYRQRYAQLTDNIRPLLATFAETDDASAELRHRAQVEYQRLRALFEQARTFNHPLLRDLRPQIDTAQAQGVDVSVHINGDLPDIPTTTTTRVAAPLAPLLAATKTSARITLTTSATMLDVSIICKGVSLHDYQRPHENLDYLDIKVTTTGETAWLTVRHRLQGTEEPHALIDESVH